MTFLEIAFISLTVVTTAFLLFIGNRAIESSEVNIFRNKLILVVALVGWNVYILVASSFKSLQSYDFPPRFALAFIIPSFIFTGVFLYLNRNKPWVLQIPKHWLIYFQSFRILVETLFVFGLVAGVFNREVTIEGYNFDMIFAISAPFIGYFGYQKRLLPNRLLTLWNLLGLVVLASVIVAFLISIYAPEIFGGTGPLLPLKAMTYPYVLIAGFLMPTAVFLHVLSIIQLRKQLNLESRKTTHE